MLAVLLEFKVKPGAENKFVEYWEKTTDIIYNNFGSLGSKLHKADNGRFVAYAQWPSLEVYESEQGWSEQNSIIREKMRATLVSGKPAILNKLPLVSDLTKEKPCEIE
ncbi:antibiotic biosynthesis monooxygenase family protein [Kangiella sediminilitoris]|uniref:ABM domain-containing protein n=1 Tax=Kangiella sediminilitoris TaxID=1144748 RepID=A0A1B3B7K7_9GAMM|nr:antibiotic biosynthesis monooxygenase [Kangiella sediminilitoris]AOE48775.1 hypothetical protein KS2013_43 [Kangiella sediminilitoris]